MKTSELIGAALDWAVAKCEGNEIAIRKGFLWIPTECYSTDWSQGGPIIEREEMTIALDAAGWEARHYDGESEPWLMTGDTPLIAAMRCYIASKLGDEVEIPEALTQPEQEPERYTTYGMQVRQAIREALAKQGVRE